MMVAPPEARANVFTSSQRLLENHGLVRARKEPSSRNPHSLIISPNLDALLEFDRKVHGIQYPANTSPPPSAPPIQSEPDGLPLPPRRKARPTSQRSPTSPKISSPLAQEVIQKQEPAKEASANLTIPNPFINSPPSLEMLAKVDDSITERDAQEPRDRQNLQALDDTTPDNDRQGTSENRGVRHQQTSSVNLPSATPVTVAHKSRVDKLLGIGKIPFGLFSESNDTSPATSPKSPKAPERSPAFQTAVPNLRERAKARGKLLKPLKDPAMIDASQQSGFSRNDLVLDIRRDDSPVHFSRRTPDYRDRERGRSQSVEPYSHDNFFVPPSRPSLDSISSTSSSIAPSTDDSRISISSAIDLSSSGHSFTDMYHTPVIPPHRASSLYDSLYTPSFERRNSDRESFIDMVSPTIPEFAIPNRSDDIPLPKAPSRTSSPKPPLPTTPKPIFTRPPPRSSSAPRYEESIYPTGKLPPTTNFLDLDERSELVRKNRKIAQVLGQSPGPDALALPDVSVRAGRPLLLPSLSSNSHHVRGTLSLSNDYETSTSSSTPRLQTLTLDNTGRRHSSPLSPDFISQFSNIINHDRVKDEYGASSRESFIDLSDDLGSAALATPKDFGHGRPSSPSQQSIFENMTPEEQAEELRRRKREKLAKLHRFLGSRVPANLVLGLEDLDSSLPPTSSSVDFPSPMSASPTIEADDAARKAWVRRRRSSSAAIFSSTWSDEVDRIKEDLNAREKAVNVRRAQKMEKMFGVAPPQTLYHTRRSPSPSIGNALALASNKLVSGWTSPGENHPPVTGQRNPNRTSYTKPKKKEHRPGTSESSKALLPKNRHDSPGFDDAHRRFSVYSHYQESLNSLNDIIDRDDRESLAELHEYLNSGDMTLPPGVMARSGGGSGERRLSVASSVKSERRRSLPARTSMVSLASEYSASTPKPDVTDFQARRRRAAKLTQFFGVDYRELITDVLESIESGLEHERKRGTLNPDEVQDLQAKLRKLRVKREGIF